MDREKSQRGLTSSWRWGAGGGAPLALLLLGTVLAACDTGGGLAVAKKRVVVSEIMYNPVGEESYDDRHEFFELHNTTNAAISLAGWSVAGSVELAFPAGTSIAGGGYLVVAKDPAALRAVYPDLGGAPVVGRYRGDLGNGGGVVRLHDARGDLVDEAFWNDDFPWPVAADALGASERWLPARFGDPAERKFRGVSLVRIAPDSDGQLPESWAPSPVNGATPGRASAPGQPLLPIVRLLHMVSARDGSRVIREDDRVTIRVGFSTDFGAVSDVEVEYFVDDVIGKGLGRQDEPLATVAAAATASHTFEASLPPQPELSLVRLRVFADRGRGREQVAPLPSDPFDDHMYFVTPEAPDQQSKSRVYHLVLAADAWKRLSTNIDPGRNQGCWWNPLWQETEPAILVAEGKVYSVRARYQGSRFQRNNGAIFPALPPGFPERKALSWKIKFPRYDRFDGRDADMVLNKMSQGCPGIEAFVSGHFMAAAGALGFEVKRYVRFYVNGTYYNYVPQYEDVNDEFLERRLDEPVGDLFKVKGAGDDQSYTARGDFSVIQPHCEFPPAERYATTYERQTHEWKTTDEVRRLIEGMHAARTEGLPALRAYLAAHFDLDALLGYVAVRNWAATWDDQIHNYYLYRRRTTGRWQLIAWDLDQEYGGAGAFSPAPGNTYDTTFFIGEEGAASIRPAPHWLKDSLFKTYREEFRQKLLALDATVLEPSNVAALVEKWQQMFSMDDFRATLISKSHCDPLAAAARVKQWAVDRRVALRRQLATPFPPVTP